MDTFEIRSYDAFVERSKKSQNKAETDLKPCATAPVKIMCLSGISPTLRSIFTPTNLLQLFGGLAMNPSSSPQQRES